MVQSAAELPARKNNGIVIAMACAGVLGAIGIAGIGFAVMAKRQAVAAPTMTQPPIPVPMPSPAIEPPPPSTGTAPVASPSDRVVTVTISPATATVEVDGEKRKLEGGKLELHGPLGGVQIVKVSNNGVETTESIAITEGGALPGKIVVPTSTSSASSSRPTGTGRVAPPPGTGSKPVPSGTGTGVNVQRTFE
jgi:hypothetical protein